MRKTTFSSLAWDEFEFNISLFYLARHHLS